MRVISGTNVNDVFLRGVDFFNGKDNYRLQDSRNGITREAHGPVTTVYQKPWQRVLFNSERDANPFFHLYEAIWMLAGSNDLRKLVHFNSGMAAFSDDNKTLNGAYGYRWRHQFDVDQLSLVIDILKKDPDSRRAVLQMWDVIYDLDSSSKDVPCNTNIYFKIRDEQLHMTVCNRSNDMIWGAYGANVVHMSVLQEYMAASLGVGMGKYYQISDSFHVYENEQWEKVKHLELDPFYWKEWKSHYPEKHYPLVSKPDIFLKECVGFLQQIPPRRLTGRPEESNEWPPIIIDDFMNYFFLDVLIPMVNAYLHHKKRDYDQCYQYLTQIKAEDWQKACFEWIKRREFAWRKKHES